MNLNEALNVITLYQELHQLADLKAALADMLVRDRTELFPIEQKALKMIMEKRPDLLRDLA